MPRPSSVVSRFHDALRGTSDPRLGLERVPDPPPEGSSGRSRSVWQHARTGTSVSGSTLETVGRRSRGGGRGGDLCGGVARGGPRGARRRVHQVGGAPPMGHVGGSRASSAWGGRGAARRPLRVGGNGAASTADPPGSESRGGGRGAAVPSAWVLLHGSDRPARTPRRCPHPGDAASGARRGRECDILGARWLRAVARGETLRTAGDDRAPSGEGQPRRSSHA